mgnify:CR=1 FL=1
MATTKKQAEMFQFPAFDVNKMSETYRDYTEKAMAQSKENYAKMKEAAESATKTMEAKNTSLPKINAKQHIALIAYIIRLIFKQRGEGEEHEGKSKKPTRR